MAFFDFIVNFGFWFGVDFLFWAWAIVTVIAFIDLFIPDPLPFVDEAVLIMISIGLLLLMAARGSLRFLGDAIRYLSHPAVIAFVATIAVLYFGNKIYQKTKGGKKK
jgi:hypothetical protein